MDILSHTCSGIAIASIFALREDKWQNKLKILGIGALGGALPDLDVISRWSGFDATFGQWFNLAPGREIYAAKNWYSHHAALHSIFAALFIGLMSLLLFWLRRRSKISFVKYFERKQKFFWAFVGAFSIHLFEDMPTPHSVWGGVRLFFPHEVYVGGYGKIWWWNNYDLFLIILAVILLNLLFQVIQKKKLRLRLGLLAFTLGVFAYFWQINHRPQDFNYYGRSGKHRHMEQASKDYQREILGDKVYTFMEKFDRALPVMF